MVEITLDWQQRDALRGAAKKGEIWRDIRTKRGVESCVRLGLLKRTRETKTRAYYALTDAGRDLAAQLPTEDEEWEDIHTGTFDPTGLEYRRYNADVDERAWKFLLDKAERDFAQTGKRCASCGSVRVMLDHDTSRYWCFRCGKYVSVSEKDRLKP